VPVVLLSRKSLSWLVELYIVLKCKPICNQNSWFGFWVKVAWQLTLWFVWTSSRHGNVWSDGSDLSQVEEGVTNRSYQTVHVCKTEFWVIQQNRKYFGFYFRLGEPDRPRLPPREVAQRILHPHWYRDQSPPTDRPKSTPDFRSIADYTYRT